MTSSRRLSAALAAIAFVAAFAAASDAQTAKRGVRAGDVYRLKNVGAPELSPDGQWVAYTVTTADSSKDKSNTDVWMTSWDGTQSIQLTSSPDAETTPRWSPDGRYLSFLSSREGGKGSQLWLLDRRGGEAKRITELNEGIDEYSWAPDSKRIALIMRDVVEPDSTKSKPKPIVIDRYRFKDDDNGYLDSTRAHLYVFDLAAKKATLLAPGRFDESNAAWSPDGKWIAFQSDRADGDADRRNNSDIFVIEARDGAQPRQLTTFSGPDTGPLAWSPDSRVVSYTRGSDAKFSAYNLDRLAVVPAAGGESHILTASLDRPITSQHFTADGKSIVFLFADDRAQLIGRIDATGSGSVQRLLEGRRVVSAMTYSKDGKTAVSAATATQPSEIYAFENGALRQLSHHNDEWLAELSLATTEDIGFKAKDGTDVRGLLIKPAGYTAGTKYPLLLRIHGGPNGQDQHAFSLERELFAANGYAVLNVNYRGSNGRGEAYQQAIFADWGNKEVVDLLAGVDYVVASGVADPDRLGIGGWSYGGILTDYTTATTTRFKAAISGAGSALQSSLYGVDEYIVQYDTELGPPWKSQDLYIKLSYPFYHADRITTPTLYLGGDKDFNVPLVGGEQMYQALRSLDVPTQLVIYPDQHHALTRPSFLVDRLARYVAWYDKYLKPGTIRP